MKNFGKLNTKRGACGLARLPARTKTPTDPKQSIRGIASKELARARHQSMSDLGVITCPRVRPVDPRRGIPAQYFVGTGSRLLRLEEYVVASCSCSWIARKREEEGKQGGRIDGFETEPRRGLGALSNIL